ncbi:hypothetical protein [Massilia sp. CCM 8734]|uniref:hypothetical protein n=1 Tax=Massilia sp. CCM 8734 TaxID=2609283 RepID=UPI00141FA0ED|nr:hypothetical protein [Massilia sp. CCM 8734]NHZ97823.1 hypothetical protein [Massilia sp. CCM 8734]
MFVNLQIKNDVQLVAPVDSCCNCGSTQDVRMEATDLRRLPLFGLAGAEIKIELPFPYCSGCVSSSQRRRPTVLGIAAVTALLSLVLGMCWIFFGPQFAEEKIVTIVVPMLVITSLCIVLGFYGLRRPSAKQSSFYQPVKLRNTGHQWPADITGLELAFTNHDYGKKFADANRTAIAAKKLKVVDA